MKIDIFSPGHLFSSIRAKSIAIFVILGIIPLILAGFFAYKTASNALLRQTREQLGNLADKTAQQIDTFIEVCEKDINLLSNFPFIQLSFLQFEFGQKLDTAKRLLEDYEKKNRYYRRIHLIDLKGRPIISIPGKIDDGQAAFPDRSWFKPALKNEVFLSNVLLNSGIENSFVVLSKKIYDFEEPEKPVGILVFEIRLSSFTTFVSSLKIGTKGYAFLINNQGVLLYHPDSNINLTDTFIHSGDERFKRLLKQIQSGNPGFGHYRFKETRKYMVFTPCRIKDWRVGITLQKSEFMADIIKLRRSIMTFSALIITLIGFVSLLFAKSLTLPISQLVTGARAIGAGNLDQTISVASSQELKGLADEFNNMAARLKESMQKIVDLKTFSDNTLRSVSSGIITVDKKGQLTSINQSAEKILSFEHRELPESDHVPPGIKKSMALLVLTLGKKQTFEHQMVEFTNARGEPVFIEINTSLLYDGKGRIIGAIADIRDITTRKRIDQLMIRVDKLASLGELSAGIAHEIRNPLAGMKTSIQVLAKRLSSPSQLMLVNGILSEIDRLNEIVTDLLKFSGPSPNFPGAVDIRTIIQRTLDLLMERIKKLNIRIDHRYEADLPDVFVDKEQIQQVILNLMLNAVNAMPDGGDLTVEIQQVTDQDPVRKRIGKSIESVSPDLVSLGPVPPDSVSPNSILPDADTSREHDYISVCFSDTGAGIKADDLSRVFDPFFTTDPNGTGLGLSIAHKLVEKNNAFIYLDSKENQGCHVTLIIPTRHKTPYHVDQAVPDHSFAKES